MVGVLIAVLIAVLGGLAVGTGLLTPQMVMGISSAIIILVILGQARVLKSLMLLIALLFLLLTIYPVARVVLPGNLPLYFVDAIAGLLLLTIGLRPRFVRRYWSDVQPLPILVLIYMFPSTIFSTINEISLTGVYLEPLYMLVRTFATVGMFFVIATVTRRYMHVKVILWCLTIGMAVTAVLSMLNSWLPLTHPIQTLMDDLSPINLSKAVNSYLIGGQPIRGRALLQSPLAVGGLISLAWPLALGLYLTTRDKIRQYIIVALMIIAAVGLLTSYSRIAYMNFAIVLVMFVFMSPTGSRGSTRQMRTLAVIAAAVLVLVPIAVNAGLLRFDWIIGKFEDLAQPGETSNDMARILAYEDMFKLMTNGPSWLLFYGRGFSAGDLLDRGLIELSPEMLRIFAPYRSSVWVSTFYERGLLSALLLTALALLTLWVTQKAKKLAKDDPFLEARYNWLLITLQISICCQLPAWVFDHYLVSLLYVQAVLFGTFGLAVALYWLIQAEQAQGEGAVITGKEDVIYEPASILAGKSRLLLLLQRLTSNSEKELQEAALNEAYQRARVRRTSAVVNMDAPPENAPDKDT